MSLSLAADPRSHISYRTLVDAAGAQESTATEVGAATAVLLRAAATEWLRAYQARVDALNSSFARNDTARPLHDTWLLHVNEQATAAADATAPYTLALARAALNAAR